MEKKKITIGIFDFAAIAILSLGMVSAMGFGNGMFNQNLTEDEKAELDAQREAMQEAIQNGDYPTWKSLMEDRIEQMKNQITEENFNQLVERHQEMEQARANGELPEKGFGHGDKAIMRNGECQALSE